MFQQMMSTPLKAHKSTCDTRSDISTDHDDNEHIQESPLPTKAPRSPPSSASKTKSSLCRNFTEKGYCPYGGRCQFAHGPQELRINMESNRSYKTKGCHAFLKKGYCCYGDRCNFIHVKEETTENPQERWSLIFSNHRETIKAPQLMAGSRLLSLLQVRQSL